MCVYLAFMLLASVDIAKWIGDHHRTLVCAALITCGVSESVRRISDPAHLEMAVLMW